MEHSASRRVSVLIFGPESVTAIGAARVRKRKEANRASWIVGEEGLLTTNLLACKQHLGVPRLLIRGRACRSICMKTFAYWLFLLLLK